MEQYITLGLFGLGVILGGIGLYLFRRYVAPWIAEKREELKQQMGEDEYFFLEAQIRMFMSMAETQLGAGNGKAKSELVISWIKKAFPDIDEAYVQALIDGLMMPLTQEGIVNVDK